MRTRLLAVCTVSLLLASAGRPLAADDAGLFSADIEIPALRRPAPGLFPGNAFPEGEGRSGAPGGALPPVEGRSRVAGIDLGRLSAARSDVARGRSHPIRLNLFADADFKAVLEHTAPTASGYTLTGRLADDPLSTVVVAVNGLHVAGTVWTPRGIYGIQSNGGPAVIRRLNPQALGRCGVGEAPAARPAASPGGSPTARRSNPDMAASAPGNAFQSQSAAPADDGGTIDVLVVYTDDIRILHGGHRAMRAMIDRDVAMTNEAYRRSGAAQRIALVGAIEVDYAENIIQNISFPYLLNHLNDTGDGHFEDVHGLRDRYAADLVLLHVGDLLGWQGGAIFQTHGIAFGTSSPAGDERLAFSIASSHAFAHELGHSMGLNHERQHDRSNEPFPYSHGYRFEVPCSDDPFWENGTCEWSTIMAAQLPTLPRFSTPMQKWPDESGVPLGVPGDEPSGRADGPADAVRSLNEMRRVIANYRASATRCQYTLSPESPLLPAAGGEFRVRVEAARGCAWSARSDGGFPSVAEGAGGVGDGEVVYRVPANPGWEREAAILLAAEVYLVRQEGARPIAPVCGRSPAVSEAIVAALGKPCAEIAGADLASLGTLRVYPARGGALKSGDFSGLSGLGWLSVDNPYLMWEEKPSLRLAPDLFEGLAGLRYLGLQGNSISAVPPGLFKGLSDLRHLDLSINQLAELAPGVFDGLDNLRYLSLGNNDLSRLPPGLFRGLPNLWKLFLYDNRLTALPLGAFDGLSGLQDLELGTNSLTALESGLFNGLSNLSGLGLAENSLAALPPGLFDGLTNLLFLNLSENRLTTLPAGLLHDLPNLYGLIASDNQLAALAPEVLAGHPLRSLWLDGNGLGSLPPGLFEGVTELKELNLSNNPGAPFALTLELVAASAPDSPADRSAAVVVEVASGVPFAVQAGVSAAGGALSAHSTLLETGRTRGELMSVAPQGDGPVTVELDSVSGVPKEWQCDNIFQARAQGLRCYRGVRLAVGAPLVLYGFADHNLAPGAGVKFDLPTAFPNFSEGTAYAVELSNPAAVEATVRDSLLILSAADSGETEVAVTATGPDGRRETRRFTVTVEQSVKSLWGGWRSALLRPPPAEDDGG